MSDVTVDAGSTIWELWLKKRARMGSRKVGGRRVRGVRSSSAERRRALLMIAGLCVVVTGAGGAAIVGMVAGS